MEFFWWLAGFVVGLFTMAVLYPERATCPAGWHNNGVTRQGDYTCTRSPVGDPDWDGTWRRPERGVVPPGELRGRLYCTGGMHPLVVDERTVGCQR